MTAPQHLADAVEELVAAEDGLDREIVEAMLAGLRRRAVAEGSDPAIERWTQEAAGDLAVSVLEAAESWARTRRPDVPLREIDDRPLAATGARDLLREIARRWAGGSR